MIRRIAVLTGDDDAPGMNAIIRAVTRTALSNGWDVQGVRNGYAGLIRGLFMPLTARNVGGIVQRGGTMLGSVDSKEFQTEGGQRTALYQLAEHNIDALIVIGGQKALANAYALSQIGVCVNGVAASVENDIVGSDMTVGVDTALNIALDTIDHLKTITSIDCYAFLVEVAGRSCGYLALTSAIAGGAEAVIIPEVETTPQQIADAISISHQRGKSHAIIVVAEGTACNVNELVQYFSHGDPYGQGVRGTTLCQIQRGGAPSAFDRLLAARLGACAVDALAHGEYGVLAGYLDGKIGTTPLCEIVGRTKEIDLDLLPLSDVLAL